MKRRTLIGTLFSVILVAVLAVTSFAGSELHADFNHDGIVDSADAACLLRHVYSPEDYPIDGSADVNGDGKVNSRDSTYLLLYIDDPEGHPLNITHTMGKFVPTGEFCGSVSLGHADCTVCGENIYTVGHDLQRETVFAGCDTEGYDRVYCDRCDYEEVTYTPANGHMEGDWETVSDPGCTTEGKAVRKCIFCEKSVSEKAVSATGHTFVSYVTDDICTYICNVCGYTETDDVSSKCKISFVLDGDVSVGDVYAGVGESVVLPTPVREGYSFRGWFAEESLVTLVGSSIIVSDDITLYGAWVSEEEFTGETGDDPYETNASKDYLFGVICDFVLNDGNVSDYITVVDSENEEVSIFVDRYEDGVYYIGGEYEEGSIYKAKAGEGITFASCKENDELWFVIDGEKRTDVSVKEDIETISDDYMVAAFEDDGEHYIIFTEDLLDSGDVALVCGDGEGEFIVAMKVLAEDDFEGCRIYSYEPLSPEEVFDEYDLFINESLSMEDVVFSDTFEEDLEAALMSSEAYQNFAEAAEAYALKKSALDSEYYYTFSKINVEKPQFEILSEDEKGVLFAFKISCDFDQIDRRTGAKFNQFTIALNMKSKVTLEVSADVGWKGAVRGNFKIILSTVTDNSAFLTISTKSEIDNDKELDWFRMMYEEFESKGETPKLVTTPGGKKERVEFLSVSAPFWGFHFNIDLSNVFEFEISGQIGVGFEYTTVNQVTVEAKRWDINVNATKSSNMTIKAYLAGKITISEGINLGVGIDFLKVVEARVDFTFSVYFEMGGAADVTWNNYTGFKIKGAIYAEAGLKFEGNFSCEVFWFESKPIQLFEPWKYVFFTYGDKKMPLKFAATGEEYDLTVKFGEQVNLNDIVNSVISYQDLITFETSNEKADGLEYYIEGYKYRIELSPVGVLKVLPGLELNPVIKIKVVKGNVNKIITLNVTVDHEHTITKEFIQGGCTKDTIYRYTCTECGASERVTEQKAPGHNFGDWVTVYEETCLYPGEYYRDCTACDKRDTKKESALGHTYGDDHSCIRCGICKHSYSAMIPTQTYLSKKASCITLARYRYSCEYCYSVDPNKYHTFEYGEYALHVYADEFTCHDRDCIYPGCDFVCEATTPHNFVEFESEIGGCATIDCTVYFCIDCKFVDTDLEDDVIHNTHDFVVMAGTPATCTESGISDWLECSRCHLIYEQNEIKPLGHSYAYEQVDEDVHLKICDRDGCDDTFGEIRHIYGDWNVVRKATCTSKGYRFRICEHCDYMQEQIVDATGHDLTYYDAKAATCYVSGHNAYEECNSCDYTTIVVIPKLEHDYDTVWTFNGEYHWHKCKNGCNSRGSCDSHDEATEVILARTCETDGILREYCADGCGYEKRVQDPAGHRSDGEVLYDDDGHYYICVDCKAEVRESHRIKEKVTVKATCTKSGEKNIYCTVCDYSRTDVIPELEHDYETEWSYDGKKHWHDCVNGCGILNDEAEHSFESTTISEGTCAKPGKIKFTCTECGYSYTKDIIVPHDFAVEYTYNETHHWHECVNGCGKTDPKVEHDFEVIRVIVPAKCETDGLIEVRCTVCGYITEKVDPKPGHSFGENYGYDETHHWIICDNGCGNTSPGVEHDFEVIRVIVPAKCETDGREEVCCTACRYITERVIPNPGHSFGKTYDETYHWYECENGCGTVKDKVEHSFKSTTVSEKTCAEPEKIKYYCTGCYYYYYEEGTIGDHVYDDTPVHNGTYHWYECVYECGAKIEEEEHSFDYVVISEGTCAKPGKIKYFCTGCNYFYTEDIIVPHDFEDELVYDETHHWYECECGARDGEEKHTLETETIKATCTTPGQKYTYCTVCDYNKSEPLPILGHLGTKWYNEKKDDTYVHYHICERTECGERFDETACTFTDKVYAPTCYKSGYTEHTCGVCGFIYKDSETTRIHQLEQHQGKEATCTEPGWNPYVTCIWDDCDYTTYKEIPILPHEYDYYSPYHYDETSHFYECKCGARDKEATHTMLDAYVIKEATCTEDGIIATKCAGCPYTSQRTEPAPGHTKGNATCTEDYFCERCGELVKPAPGHDYKSKTTKPTCEEYGYTTHICTECGYSYIDAYTDPVGHKFGTKLVYDDNTHYYVCGNTGCTAKDSIGAHTNIEGTINPEATCTTPGSQPVLCSVCGRVDSYIEHPALGHEWEWYLECETKDTGEEIIYTYIAGKKCYVCDAFEPEGETVVHEHYGVKFTTPVAPTCTTVGYMNGILCSVCGELLRDPVEIPAKGHSYSTKWNYNTTQHWHDCANGCDAKGSTAVHDFDSDVLVESTCTEAGLVKLTCRICGYFRTEDMTVPPHDLTEEYQYPTCTEDGYRVTVCARCGAEFDHETLPALGHDYSMGDDTCIRCGASAPIVASKGLKYTLSSNGTYYIVSGIGTCTDTDVVIPSTYEGLPVKAIGNKAFYNCKTITSVVIPDGVTSISSYAFYYCTSLTSIEIPEGVTSMGDYAFYNCTFLTTIEIPKGVTSIGDGVFRECTSLTTIEIPEGVTSIDNYAFYGCTSLTSIVIPSSVTSIGSDAFYGCTSLTTIEIPEGVTSIGSYAFYGCTSLTTIEIPEGVTSIGTRAFYNCKSLTSINIPEGVTSIGKDTFYNCKSLTSINIPEGVTSIGSDAFAGCTSLTGVYINDIVSWCNISFANNTSNPLNYAKNLYLDGGLVTELVIPEGVMSIGKYTFYGCISLTTIEIPEGVTSIGSSAFRGCTSLTTIEIPEGVTSIGERAFHGCASLTTIEIPSSVTSIGDYAFYGCASLTTIEIPSSVTSIGDSAFSGCSSLTTIVIPEGVTSIYSYTFDGCSSLTTIEIPEGVTSIGSSAFRGCTSLTTIEIPEGVTSIGGYAFSDCSSLTAIEIPEGVTSIGVGAFSDCSSLTTIEIPEGVTSIYSYTFDGCSSLTTIVIPSSVTSIGKYTFYDCSSLTTIEIPEGVTSIGSSAFRGCTSLTTIEIPEGVTSIGDYAFAYCSSLTTIEISSSVTSIGDYAFRFCKGLTNIDVSENNTAYKSVNGVLFTKDGKTVIQYPVGKVGSAYTIPSGVTSIGNYTFYGCTSLTTIEIPEGVTSIGNYAFYGCTSLTTIELPSSLTSIGNSAFSDCTFLTTIVIPSSVTSIGSSAFYRCYDLTHIYYGGTPEQWSALSNKPSEGTVYYYSESVPDFTTGYSYWHYVGDEVVIWKPEDATTL